MRDNKIITGVHGVLEHVGKRHPQKMGENYVASLHQAKRIIMRLADYYCPKDTLALVLSGEGVVEGKGLNAGLRINYGGEEAPYALWVHEDQSKWHDPPTSAKWLERAIRETRGAVTNVIKRVMSAGVHFSKDGFEVE